MSTGRSSSSDAKPRTFRLEHEGQEYVVLSVPVTPSSAPLTRAELEVARAIVRGMTNAEIARVRGTSVRTVANQVASILQRLGASSRSQVAAKLSTLHGDPLLKK